MKPIKWIFCGLLFIIFCWVPLVYASKSSRVAGVSFWEACRWEYVMWWQTFREGMRWENL